MLMINNNKNYRHQTYYCFSLLLVSYYCCVTTAFVITSPGGALVSKRTLWQRQPPPLLLAKKKDNDEDDEIDLSNRDWRAFRAQLVMSNTNTDDDDEDDTVVQQQQLEEDEDLDGIGSIFQSSSTATASFQQQPQATATVVDSLTPLEPSQWAYDSGKVIEQGAVILGGVEQDYGFGLRQQYFHKAVILVLDHCEKTFTKGIILNRPSDILLEDDSDGNSSNKQKWRIWFGGDVQGLYSIMPEIVCLHSIQGDDNVNDVSTPVMNDIQWTSFEQAKLLVKQSKGRYTSNDFWCFAGYAGWGSGQLMGELDRKSWYMCATDSQTLLKELAKQSIVSDPRNAGLDTWELLMQMIGRGSTADECSGDFEDLMLKEWARQNLVSIKDGDSDATPPPKKDVAVSKDGNIKVGTVLRASSANRSPFLLQNQEYHKSIILVISDHDKLTAGVILNHPSTNQGLALDTSTSIPIRYGGPYDITGNNRKPLILHMNPKLRVAGVGSAIGVDAAIFTCTEEQAKAAIRDGLAVPLDFLIVGGISIWKDGIDEQSGTVMLGMKGQVEKGYFDVVPNHQFPVLWEKLQQQNILTKMNLIRNLSHANEAWEAAGGQLQQSDEEDVVTSGIGEGFDEDDDSLVFKSDVPVSKLSDDALRSWVAAFLLGAPTLGA